MNSVQTKPVYAPTAKTKNALLCNPFQTGLSRDIVKPAVNIHQFQQRTTRSRWFWRKR